ncbi:MAG: trigger factor [Candidatus Adiutrix sp.]|nr:trigger factor [Candidatus Adiutrix sp.]
MNVTIEEVNSIRRKLIVELPEEDARKTWRKLLDAYVRKARLKGFRPGKAPRDMVARVYAEELKQEITEELVSEAVPAILKEHDLTPMGSPVLDQVDYQDGLPLKFSVLVELKPVFEAPEWRGLRLQRPRSRVDGEAVAKKLEELRQSLASVKKLEEDRPLAKGDLASVSYRAYGENGAELPKYGAGPFDLDLVDDQQVAPGFIEGLVGLKAGETKDITVTLPQDVDDRKMAGRTLRLATTVHELKIREVPDLDDEFAKDLGLDGVETLAALEERLRRDLLKEEADRADRLLNLQLTNKLAELVTLDLPTVMVEREMSRRFAAISSNFSKTAFQDMGVDPAQLRERLRPRAEKSVAAALVLDRIGLDNQVEVTPEDIEAELADMSREYGQPPEVLREYYKSHNLMDNLLEGLKISKTMDIIKAQAVIEEVDKLETGPMAESDWPGRPAADLGGAGEDGGEAPGDEAAEGPR